MNLYSKILSKRLNLKLSKRSNRKLSNLVKNLKLNKLNTRRKGIKYTQRKI